MVTEEQRNSGYRGTEEQWAQRNSGHRGTVGTEAQRHRGTEAQRHRGTEEQWAPRNSGHRGTEAKRNSVVFNLKKKLRK